MIVVFHFQYRISIFTFLIVAIIVFIAAMSEWLLKVSLLIVLLMLTHQIHYLCVDFLIYREFQKDEKSLNTTKTYD